MIVVCIGFYPWYREHDRTEEVFDVLINSMNKVKQKDKLALSICDGGTQDIWGRDRVHNILEFRERLQKAWQGKLYYFVDHLFVGNRWHCSQAIENAVLQSSEPFIFLSGMDLYLPEDFVKLYLSHVDAETCWVPFAYNVLRGAPLVVDQEMKFGNWHTAKGIVGITRINFLKVGGYCTEKIKDHCDSLFYHRIDAAFKLYERRCENLFHIAHPGSHASKKWRVDQ